MQIKRNAQNSASSKITYRHPYSQIGYVFCTETLIFNQVLRDIENEIYYCGGIYLANKIETGSIVIRLPALFINTF